ncbi:hypothetical protein M409DRAFT_66110 [Zasmidium cellare ATCC 36951]|uniref:DJ-1/PfpI domain-containing protein n=1 Tax=Zasmidium cellare ATCC 36951 TaxID=1080233 RepID=A0A6A6CNF7_ZASCE|nr:uncharacterized protein M409DRAFT_66110 [Zasmidium cellare ATCC 36951]KAF2166996.1 hypothetical protein M409DRAFT_66110 [Zasmidium cellare ATCC 36951]
MSFPKSFGILLYPRFELLDAAGPLEALICLSRREGFKDMRLSVISETMDPVSVGQNSSDANINTFANAIRLMPTHTLDTAPPLDVLIVPGGIGSIDFERSDTPHHVDKYVDFVRRAYRGEDERQPLKYLISVCNGAMLLAKAGVLDGHRVTTTKDLWHLIPPLGPKSHWIARARWHHSDNIWTTSGVSAGVDGTLAWMESLVGHETVESVVNTMEWIRAEEADNDPFAKVFGAQDVPPKA